MATLVERAERFSDADFERMVTAMQEGRDPFSSPDELRRFAETVIDKLWEQHEQPVEPD